MNFLQVLKDLVLLGISIHTDEPLWLAILQEILPCVNLLYSFFSLKREGGMKKG